MARAAGCARFAYNRALGVIDAFCMDSALRAYPDL
ncbi:MAG: helix-turn-helix domain-containing protein [Azoarcus sp.]|nr:helix-turn-helix domain-containing protein [Azoarcus sp.]